MLKLIIAIIARRSRGQTMTEYALILAAIAVAAILAYQNLGTQISTLAGNVASDL
jgi:Flp pilus assembly pilin Flp